jgi:VWFA-related protein
MCIPRGMVLFMAGISNALVFLVFALAAIAVSAQNAPQTPAISVSTRLVQIGVTARDKNGLVANLTKDDFVVLDRGKPQKISVFSVEASDSAPQATQPLPQNTFSDLPQYAGNRPHSVTIVLLDNLNTFSSTARQPYEDGAYWVEQLALANAKQHLVEFLKQLNPSDRIAIYGLADSLHVLCDFTCDRDALLSVVSKYDATSKTRREDVEPSAAHIPGFLPGDDRPFNGAINGGELAKAAVNNQVRAQTTMAALTAIAAHVANIPGRKNLLWLTSNLPFSGGAIASILSHANIAAYPVDARGLLSSNALASREYVDNCVAYSIDCELLAAQSGEPIGIDSMREMADDTGGRAFVNTNDLTGAIRKAVEDSAVNYTLGFYMDRASIDGKFHELKVQVKRDGLTIRYPKGYFTSEDPPPTKDQNWKTVTAAVQSPLESSVIPLQAKVDRVNQPLPNSLKLSCSIDIHSLRLAQTGDLRKGAVTVYVVQQDAVGKVLGQWTKTYDLQLTEKQYAALLNSGMPFTQNLQTKPTATTLRVLVQDPATSEIGTLIIPLSHIH